MYLLYQYLNQLNLFGDPNVSASHPHASACTSDLATVGGMASTGISTAGGCVVGCLREFEVFWVSFQVRLKCVQLMKAILGEGEEPVQSEAAAAA